MLPGSTAQRFARAAQPAHDRADRNRQDLGDFRIAEFLQVHQGDHLALAQRQRRHCGAYPPHRFLGFRMAVRPRQHRRQLGEHFLVDILAPLAQVVDPAAVENREQPARQALGLAQLPDPRQAARHGFLRQIVGQGGVVAPGEGDAKERLPARLDPAGQLALLPRLQPFHGNAPRKGETRQERNLFPAAAAAAGE